MRSLLALLCISLTVVITFSSRAEIDDIDFHGFDADQFSYEPRLPIGLSWIVQNYDFDRIEEYVDERYMARYRSWEKYLTGKQREFAGVFGLSDIFVRPDFRRYENTKIALTRRVWNDRLLFKYLAPVHDMGKFELSAALKPYPFVTFEIRNRMRGESQVALVICGPLGRDKDYALATRRFRRLLGRVKRYAD